MIKKILYIAFNYEYGKKENGVALNYKAWFKNFEKLGYDVEGIFFENFDHENLQKKILQKTREINADLVFFILQKKQVDKETLKKLQNMNYFIVNFFGDDQWRFDSFSNEFANLFNACITTDKFSLEKYKAIGQKNIIRSQWASLESNVKYKDIKYNYDVSFVGGANSFRIWFIKELAKRNIKVNCFGSGWDNGRVSFEQMENIFASSKINLNISNSVQYDMRYLLASPKNIINTFRSKKKISQTKARIFEIPAHGGFELTEYVPSLEDYFDIGKEIACYNNIDEAELLINYFLTHEFEREKIKLAGVERARNEHTYKNRIIEFMKKLELMHEKKAHISIN